MNGLGLSSNSYRDFDLYHRDSHFSQKIPDSSSLSLSKRLQNNSVSESEIIARLKTTVNWGFL
ncbi:protein of unknown function [Pararobbsia alpina]